MNGMDLHVKSSEKVIEYVETNILAGKLKVDDRLPAERQLAQNLNISRTAVREGIRLLEVIGIVESRQGSGNYIVQHSEQTLEQVLTMAYTLDDLRYEEIREFRYTMERMALVLAVRKANKREKKALQKYLKGLLNAQTKEERAKNDRMLHRTLVEMSENQLVISNYIALNRVINRFMGDTHQKIMDHNREDYEELLDAHRMLVEAVVQGDLEKGKEALKQHYIYTSRHLDP